MGKVSETYNLEAVNPQLARQWHPTKNGDLTPADVTPGSHRKVWWVCDRGHEWRAMIYSRNAGTGCPYCSGLAVSEENNLERVNPELAKQWHPTKNGSLTPRDVTPCSHRKVWWICEKNHEWKATIANRSNGKGCPYCKGRLATEENNLAVKRPEIAKEWHPTKNGFLTPWLVTPTSHKEVWWLCEKGHEWLEKVSNRAYNSGCPYCRGKLKSEDDFMLIEPSDLLSRALMRLQINDLT
ncbi:MAG: zinc-ribbon domain-containing protein [Deltaproteobacteria bacterium]|nr:zinc-ribbon domain-containing protein [Deltaproteobacteria bacterium]MBW1920472.1 zinc-ribbon domain-containing protein [Deltaproteobacteria bacterium]MBW1934447.1 zinc-ribbon domain-containing protein [Deltaproteobacteria bacterium]MBW1976910.1 zinc-ribbon domain-containing protein [Deltaproteobacteria bacterium]MBW2043565.1 zinc-ribbon domain-containing protein [Deltaproteobacteria bacterium]